MAILFAIAAGTAHAGVMQKDVQNYRPVFEECRREGGAPLLAIRRMKFRGQGMALAVDPATLSTRLLHDEDWSCADTDEGRQQGTRYVRAVRSSAALRAGNEQTAGVIVNGGVVRGAGPGSFLTGDLCPSRRPLDRAFLEKLPSPGSPLPVALSISGYWLIGHRADFQWLRERERAGMFQITWVDHSYDHPYVAGRPFAENFLLSPGVDMASEILQTERQLIANGETPSVFFRFPGLISNTALMQVVSGYHLIALGAGAWLAQSARAKPGDVILIHPNGNEPAGLHIFSNLLAAGKLPLPFRPIDEAP